jgi:hypothetical protein
VRGCAWTIVEGETLPAVDRGLDRQSRARRSDLVVAVAAAVSGSQGDRTRQVSSPSMDPGSGAPTLRAADDKTEAGSRSIQRAFRSISAVREDPLSPRGAFASGSISARDIRASP